MTIKAIRISGMIMFYFLCNCFIGVADNAPNNAQGLIINHGEGLGDVLRPSSSVVL